MELLSLWNPKMLTSAGLPSEVMNCEETLPEVIQFDWIQVSMGHLLSYHFIYISFCPITLSVSISIPPLYLYQFLCSLKHPCIMIMLPHLTTRTF
jgi:hypothetical protein